MADPQAMIPTRKKRWWRNRKVVLAGAVGGTALVTIASFTMLPSALGTGTTRGGGGRTTTMGVPATCVPTFTERVALYTIRDELRQHGYVMPEDPREPHGFQPDGLDPRGRLGFEYFDPVHGTGDARLDDAWLAGEHQATLTDETDPPEAAAPEPDTIIGIFDAQDEDSLRQQVRDFIEWLETQP